MVRRGHREAGQGEQGLVVVDAPAAEVLPGLGSVGPQRNAGRGELVARDAEILLRDAARRLRPGVALVRDPEEVGDAAERQVPGPDREVGLDVPGYVHDGSVEGGPIHDRARGVHPGVIALRRPEERQCGERRVGLADVGEPRLPQLELGVEVVHPPEAMEALEHRDRRRRRIGPHLQQVDCQLAARE